MVPRQKTYPCEDGALGNRLTGTGAVFSPCGRYRYKLWRVWDPDRPLGCVMFLMLNPSTATDTEDDPTIRRCVGYARSWGYGGLCVGNLFAYRATDPTALRRAAHPVGPDNDRALRAMVAQCGLVVAAWGSHGAKYVQRVQEVLNLVRQPLYCLRPLRSGHPAHPLRQRKDIRPPLPRLDVGRLTLS